jgi:hypothetical protein
VLRAERQRSQDQKIERSLRQVDCVCGHPLPFYFDKRLYPPLVEAQEVKRTLNRREPD